MVCLDMDELQLILSDKLINMEGNEMAVTVNIYYSGENGNARKFAEEMVSSGVVRDIRQKKEI